MEQKDILDHQFVIAAYTVTWVLQLGYVVYLAFKWRAEKKRTRSNSKGRP